MRVFFGSGERSPLKWLFTDSRGLRRDVYSSAARNLDTPLNCFPSFSFYILLVKSNRYKWEGLGELPIHCRWSLPDLLMIAPNFSVINISQEDVGRSSGNFELAFSIGLGSRKEHSFSLYSRVLNDWIGHTVLWRIAGSSVYRSVFASVFSWL